MSIQEHFGSIIYHAGSALKEGVVFTVDALENLLRHEMSLDEIAKVYNDELDKMIIAEVNSTGKTYVGGAFYIRYIDDTSFGMSVEMYFQNEKKEWSKKANESKPQSVKFLNLEARNELREKQEVKYEIDPPKNFSGLSQENGGVDGPKKVTENSRKSIFERLSE